MKRGPRLVTLNLPPLEPATASWLFDLCGQLHHEILQKYGDELEAYWTPGPPPTNASSGGSAKPARGDRGEHFVDAGGHGSACARHSS